MVFLRIFTTLYATIFLLGLIAGKLFHQQYYNGLRLQLAKENQSLDIPMKTKVMTNKNNNNKKKNQANKKKTKKKKKNQDEDDNRNEVGSGSEVNNEGNLDKDKDEDEDDATDSNKKRTGTVYWMDYKSIRKNSADYYSGSWYMPIKKFKENLNVNRMNTLEDASGTIVYLENEKTVRMPYGWFDFSVEHMSRWYKDLDVTSPNQNDLGINKINSNLFRYIQDTPQKMIKTTTTTTTATTATTTAITTNTTIDTMMRTRNRRMKEQTNNTTVSSLVSTPQQSSKQQLLPLLHPTIAIIPFAPNIRYDTPVSVSRSKNLTTLMLGATISSLIRLGFGRIVLVGIDDNDDSLANDTVNLIKLQFTTTNKNIQFSYVQVTDKKTYESKWTNVNRPKAAICGLQLALQGKLNNTDIDLWLGTKYDHNYWIYIYFTEPDLVLQTRINGVTSTIPSLYEELNRGHTLMPFDYNQYHTRVI
jgi:hypothetical protein